MELSVVRLKRYDEERLPEIATAFVVEVNKEDVKRVVRLVSKYKVPKHLKRVKKSIGDNKFLILVGMKDSLAKEDKRVFEKYTWAEIGIPQSTPLTLEQNTYSQKLWPCYFHPVKEPSVSICYVNRMLRILKREETVAKKGFCAGVCIITGEEVPIDTEFDTDNVLGHSVFKSISKVSKKKHTYLCTGLDAFLYKEPCLSCAMAFVHGRIGRVFLLHCRSEGPYTSLKLCYNKNLNHRYPVYKIEECSIL